MSIGVLLLTHAGLGTAVIAAARSVVGPITLKIATVEYVNGREIEEFFLRAGRELRELDQGDGVLVLTDVYGATPSNVAARLTNQGTAMRRVSGLNLPMLLRVLNYGDQTLDELTLIAAQGARNGVVVDSV